MREIRAQQDMSLQGGYHQNAPPSSHSAYDRRCETTAGSGQAELQIYYDLPCSALTFRGNLTSTAFATSDQEQACTCQ